MYSRRHLWLILRVVISTLPRLRTILPNNFFLTIEKISESGEVLTIIFSNRLSVNVAISFYGKHSKLLITWAKAAINIRLFFAHKGIFLNEHFHTGKLISLSYLISILLCLSSILLSWPRSCHPQSPLSSIIFLL